MGNKNQVKLNKIGGSQLKFLTNSISVFERVEEHQREPNTHVIAEKISHFLYLKRILLSNNSCEH